MEKLTFAEVNVEEMIESARIIVENLLGRKVSDADPIMLLLKSFIAIIAQQKQLIDESANQNLLYYATEKNLEALGQLVGVKRLPASAAFCTVELTLSAVRNKENVIPAGVRIDAGNKVHFATAEDVIFLAGETVKTCKAVCLQVGEVGNNFAVGELNKIVDPQPFLKSIVNITESEGGADIEDDENLRERIRIAPESFSVAGSRGAYEFWTKDFSSLIIDSYVESPEPGKVDVYFLMEGGEVPQEEMIQGVQEHLSADVIRPLTDFVTVKPPEIISYDIEARYFISRSQQTQALQIQNAAQKAVEDFILWQSAKLGRDLNQTELYWRLRSAGVKRAEILNPVFTVTPQNAVAICQNVNLIYGGLEDD